ncbi:MAG: cytidine deaminase [Bacteroidales bacterium]|jgi:cytidine deaminase|nr:cytidine deaminase [Bacteroidales bacterium]
MKHIVQTIDFQEYLSSAELPGQDRELLETARAATLTSYAPYSHYHVGAAVRLTGGQIVTGSNQENISFPAGLCAERVALFAAVSQFPGIAIEAIAISARADNFDVTEPVPPCGMCRQAIAEYEMKFNKGIRIILGGETGKALVIDNMEQLLPLMFREKGLVKP